MIIDTHQHFWKYDPIQYGWIDEAKGVLKRDFLPQDLKPIYEKEGIAGCVAVQAMQSEAENDFLLTHAHANDFIMGVVGWVDLQADQIEERLLHYKGTPKLSGFRHVVQDEPDENFMLRPAFQRGLSFLHAYGFTYDILIFPNQMQAALKTVEKFPDQAFVVDHIAKPYIKAGKIEGWKQHMQAIAQHPNVYCKLSGMITEADWQNWQYDDFVPFLDVVANAFGPERLMYGSDWPVCLLAGSYTQMKEMTFRYLEQFSAAEKDLILYQNAKDFYKL